MVRDLSRFVRKKKINILLAVSFLYNWFQSWNRVGILNNILFYKHVKNFAKYYYYLYLGI